MIIEMPDLIIEMLARGSTLDVRLIVFGCLRKNSKVKNRFAIRVEHGLAARSFHSVSYVRGVRYNPMKEPVSQKEPTDR